MIGKISLVNSIIQTIIMILTVGVTWGIYKRKQKDTKKDVARKVIVEYEKSIDLLNDAKQIISEDASQFDIMKLLAIDYINCDFWDDNRYTLQQELNASEFKNVEIYFRKFKILFEILETIKQLTKDQYTYEYQNSIKNSGQPAVKIFQPTEYTQLVVEKCKEIELLLKIFPKEKLETIAK